MAIQRSALLAVALALLVAVVFAGEWPESCGKEKSHHAYFGGRNYNDRILYTNQTVKDGSFLSKWSYDVELPPKGTPPRGIITYVEVLDQFKNGDGACAYLKSGGPGFNYVTLHVKSQRGEGVNFIVNVYGN